ncbi:hypothetical protein AGLY_002163 [Aphis glycines]|uniref:Uncharacterized protein n=1 Tax=Aphis glycines TaxID=307491 RepID=A0A6G0U348_APHGL|nr:hypothetical protein AGLY_002163 [Aphis glycines]
MDTAPHHQKCITTKNIKRINKYFSIILNSLMIQKVQQENNLPPLLYYVVDYGQDSWKSVTTYAQSHMTRFCDRKSFYIENPKKWKTKSPSINFNVTKKKKQIKIHFLEKLEKRLENKEFKYVFKIEIGILLLEVDYLIGIGTFRVLNVTRDRQSTGNRCGDAVTARKISIETKLEAVCSLLEKLNIITDLDFQIFYIK